MRSSETFLSVRVGRRFGAIALAIIATGCAAAPIQPPDTVKAGSGLACETFCSRVKVGTSTATLSWTCAVPFTNALRLDATVYKRGFEDGAFASFFGLDGARRRASPVTSRPEIRGLRAFDLRLREARRAMTEAERSWVVIEELEPGLNYRWRLIARTKDGLVASEAAVCQALVCPGGGDEED